jgi:di/tricarboxylate transporter
LYKGEVKSPCDARPAVVVDAGITPDRRYPCPRTDVRVGGTLAFMESTSVWEKLLLGVLVVLVILWFRPGIKAAFSERRHASQAEWLSALIPIALVAAFVVLLIILS